MDFEIGEAKASNAPIPEDKLSELIKTTYENLKENGDSSVDKLLQKLLTQLNSHSSFYKYIVSISTLETKGESTSNENCNMSNAIGASWNPRKDGLFNYNLSDDADSNIKHLVTVIWVAK